MLRAIRWAGPCQKWVVEELPDSDWEVVLEKAARDFFDPHTPTPAMPSDTRFPRGRWRE